MGRELAQVAPPGASVVVACSGGPDSSAALVAIARGDWKVSAAHFDHGVRPAEEADGDRSMVARLGARLGVPVLTGSAGGAAPGASEARSREARYRWLAAACAEAGAGYCVTAHTIDDQAETVLLRLARGSGLAGVAGMARRAPWPLGGVDGAAGLVLARPLLGVGRAEVEGYLRALGLRARHDPSNDRLDYARNRVRRRVLPELERVHAGAAAALAQFAARARLDDEALEGMAGAEFARIGIVGRGVVELERRGLRSLPPALAARVLRRAAGELGLAANAGQLDALARAARRRGVAVDLAGGRALSGETMLTIERSSRRPAGESGT